MPLRSMVVSDIADPVTVAPTPVAGRQQGAERDLARRAKRLRWRGLSAGHGCRGNGRGAVLRAIVGTQTRGDSTSTGDRSVAP